MLLFLIFLYSFFLTVTLPALFPTLRLEYFTPFLIFAFYRSSKSHCMWLALLCGLIVDLFSAQMHFGTYALNYTLTVFLLYNFKNYFFEDSFATLPLMTLNFIYVSALLQLILLEILTSESLLSWEWFRNALIKIPIYNFLYCLLFFALIPFFFPNKLKRTPLVVKFKQ